ncbi:hypothetical protein T484DRAFT_1920919 [Baffinella frigidus]|nr:hypothetical protein T484DRAFT_1920919 [Cryptophyta sp. CCMP2293]
MDVPTGCAASEDVVSRAVRMLVSPKTAAHIACSNSECKSGMRVSADPECGSALRICMESLCMGGSTGRWTPNHHVDELFVRANCVQTSLQNGEILALLVGRGAVVLGAQQVITAGLEHDMFGTGFKAALKSLTHHECNTCAAGPGKSLRLRLDARTLFDTEVALVAAAIHDVVSCDPKVRLRCGVQCENHCCGESIKSGALLTPPCATLKQKSKTQAILDFLELFAKGESNYNFTPLNTFCDKHNFSFPRPCKPSTAMVREAATLSLKRKAEGVPVAKGGFQKREERWIGDFKEGVFTKGALEHGVSSSVTRPTTVLTFTAHARIHATFCWADSGVSSSPGV